MAAITLDQATLKFGNRVLWRDMSMQINSGEFVAVLGPNGTGKTTLLQILLGQQPLSTGTLTILGKAPGAINHRIGYIPQQKNFDRQLPVRGRDLVRMGLDGNRFGWGRAADTEQRVQQAIDMVDAADFADRPLGLLSGGEQQRLRVAQALVGEPALVLCDEPLLSLDVTAQQNITKLLNDYRQRMGATILFVTHEINPVLPYVDRVLYLAAGRWLLDTPDTVLQSAVLSKLYSSPVEVLHIQGRLLVVGGDGLAAYSAHHEEHHL